MRRALIIGCGYTGTALASRLADDGVQVSATALTAGRVRGTPIRLLDLKQTREPDLPEADGAVVYYMVPTLCRVYHGAGAQGHLAPLEAALHGLARRKIQGLVYLSSTSVYGDRQGEWVDETTPPAPGSSWGQMRVDLEHRIWRFGQKRGIKACVLRLPEIYGPGRGPVARLRQGYTMRFPHRYGNRIHLQDLVEVLAQMGQELDRDLLLVSDGNPATTEEVYGYAARLLGMGPVPLAGTKTLEVNRLALLSESKRCRNDRLLAWRGRPLDYPSYREGLPATL